MPAFVAWLLWGIGSMLASWLGRVLFTLGLSIVASEWATPSFMAMIQAQTSGITGDILAFIAWLRVDDFIAVVITAVGIRKASEVSIRKRASS